MVGAPFLQPSRRIFIRSGMALFAVACFPRLTCGDSEQSVKELSATGFGARIASPDLSSGAEELGELESLRANLPGFRLSRRGDWVLLSDCPEATVRPVLELLESTTTQVTRVARALQSPIERTTEPHLCVMFSSEDAYRSFAGEHDGTVDSLATGHYTAHARRSVLAAPATPPSLIDAMQRMERDPNERIVLRRSGGPSHRAPSVAASRAQSRAMVEEALDEVRLRTYRLVSHEAAHQVLAERGALPGGAACPAWLHEGMACAFETERLIGDFGPDFDVPIRREQLQRALTEGSLMPLGAMIASLARPSLGERGMLDWYAQAWSLVAWLHRERRSALAALLAAVREGRQGASPAERMQRFEQICGPLSQLEPAWKAAWQRRDDGRPHAMRATRPAAQTST